MSHPSVSVIIPTLYSTLLSDVVAAVRAQSEGSDLEIVVAGLDDVSGAGEAAIRYVSTGRPFSAAAARNLGVRAALGDYLIFLDADCVPEENWLAGYRPHSHARRAVSGAIHVVPDDYLCRAGNVASFHEFTRSLPPSPRPFLPTFSLGVPRRAVEEIGLFDETLPKSGGEDLDWTIRLRRVGYELRFDPSISVVHRPDRSTLRGFTRHAFRAGENSIRVRQRYPEVFTMPGLLYQWPYLLALSPALALAVIIRAAWRNPDVRSNWPTLPLFALSRIAWCVGGAARLKTGPRDYAGC